MGIKISEINNFRDFFALQERWADLLLEVEHDVFSTWEWMATWWKYFGKDKRLTVLLAEENGELLGIAPLMYSVHSMFGLRQGKIEFIGTGIPTYNHFLIKKESTRCLAMFYKYLEELQENWTCIELKDIPENSICLSSLNAVPKKVMRQNICLYTKLPKAYDAFLESIKRKDRKELRRTVRRLTDNGLKTELVNYSDESLVTKGMNTLFFLHQKRWRARGDLGDLYKKRIRDFHLEIAQNFSKKGLVGLYCLESLGKPLAALYGFKYNSKYYAYLTGMDPDYAKFGIGNILFSNVIAKCIEEDLNEFDFIWGSDSYKYQWKPTEKWNYKAIIRRRGAIPYFKQALFNTYWSNGIRIMYVQAKAMKRTINYE